MNKSELGALGLRIAKACWPSIELFESGSEEDFAGRDAQENGHGIQIKTDLTIATSGKVFYEIWKRSGTWNGQQADCQNWHTSSSWAHGYIFVTAGFAIRSTCAELSRAALGKRVVQIRPTAIGLLIPLSDITEKEVRFHTERLAA